MLGANKRELGDMSYVKDNIVVKLSENENDVPGAKLQSSNVEDNIVIIRE